MKRLVQILSFVRFLIGATALVRALEGADLVLVATLITFAAIAEPVIRWLSKTGGVTVSPVEARFDEMTDYLTLIVAPWVLIRLVLVSQRNMFEEILLDLPLLTGAIRYARRAGSGGESREVVGLSPVFFAFVGVTMIYLNLPVLVSDARLTIVLVPAVAVSSVLMILPIRYPSLAGVLLPIVLAIVAAMTTVFTQLLAGAVVLFGCLYVLIAPFFVRRRVTG